MPFTIAQLSDLHCGQQFFLPDLLERAIVEINDLKPDVVVCSGDLTSHGFKDEYALAKRYLDQIECKSMVVIPGNHDSRNVGYVHFEALFGSRNSVVHVNGVTIVAVDSTEPDLDNGQIGRERNSVNDAGDAIECLQRAGVDLVLSGHKHVPYAWRLEDLFIVNAGTVSSLRLRGNTRPCYNVIEFSGTHVDVWRRYPFHGQEKIIQFATDTLEFEKYTARIEGEVTAKR